MTDTPPRLLWFDCETTGLTFQDAILEVGAIITDHDFTIDGPHDTFYGMVSMAGAHYPSGGSVAAGLRLAGQPGGILPIVAEMHQKSGLWDDMLKYDNENVAPVSVHEVMSRFFTWVGTQATRSEDGRVEKFVMAGSGVSHFDFPMLRYHWPDQTLSFFHYHQRDVSVVRRLLQENCGPWVAAEMQAVDKVMGEPPHRALLDLHLFIEQARIMRGIIERGWSRGNG